MKIRTQITLLTGTLVLISLLLVLGQYFLEKERMEIFLEGVGKEEQESFNRIVNLSGSGLAIFANDYSYWDEMVEYVRNPDPVFAKENIETDIDTFQASEAYVYDADKKFIYGYDQDHSTVPPAFPEELFNQLFEDRLAHFFAEKNDMLTEFRTATIHPTDDPDRLTEPAGLLMVGKHWDGDYLSALEELTGTTIVPKSEETPSIEVVSITFPYEIKNWKNEVMETFTVIAPFPIVSSVQEASERHIWVIVVSSLLVLLFVYMFLNILVGEPIEILSQSIKKKDIALMKNMQASSSEFGTLAKLVLDFSAYEQREVFERSKRDFISIVSHELRTPLTSLRWAVEKLETHKNIPSDVLTSTIPYIKSALDRIKTLTTSMTDVSRIESGSIITISTDIKISSLIARSAEDLKPVTEAKNLTVTINEETGGNDKIKSDERLLRIIISNLLSNAAKYSNESGQIRITIQKEEQGLVINIANTGPGIPAEEQSQIFSKLFRATNASLLSPDGFGLGLYISKSFLEKLGGTISFVSIPDKETIFTIHLPYNF